MTDLEQTQEWANKVTPREIEIIVLLRHGFSTPEIAQELMITADTVECHRHNIMKKTGLKNSCHIVATYIIAGVIA